MSNTTELSFDPANPLPTLGKLAVLYTGSLLLAKQLASHARAAGVLNDEEFARIQAQCLFDLKDIDAMGLPIKDEALVITQALGHLKEVFGSIR